MDDIEGRYEYGTNQEVNNSGKNARCSEDSCEYTTDNNAARDTTDRSGGWSCTWGGGRSSRNSRLIGDCLDEGLGRR
jgi:hypothetical protein